MSPQIAAAAAVEEATLEEVEEEYQPQFTNVTVLTDKDVRLIKDTYLIAKKSSDFKTYYFSY